MTRSKIAAKHVDLVTIVQDDPQTTRVPAGTLILISTQRGTNAAEVVDFSRRMNRR